METRRRIGGLLLVAFAVRLAANHFLAPPSAELVGDAIWYHRSAALLAEGRGYLHPWTLQPTAAWPPGYPALLSVLYRAVGADPAWACFLNAVAGTATCWLAGRIALALWSPAAQVAATALMALLPSHVLFVSVVMSETVFTMGMTGLVLAALLLLRAGAAGFPWRGWVLWGLAIGAATLVRAEAVLLLAAPVLTMLVRRAPLRRVAGVAVLVAAAAAVALLPWLVRNASLFGVVVPVSTSFGRTFLIGHNAEADGGMNLYSPDAEADRRDLLAGGPARELAVDKRLLEAGLRYAREHPGDELRLVGLRLYRMYRGDRAWGEWYAPAPGSGVTARTVEMLGRVSNAGYAILLVLAAPAFVLALWRRDEAALLPLVVLVWTAFFVVVLYGSQRFHHPLMPLLCVLAAWALSGRASPRRPAAGEPSS